MVNHDNMCQIVKINYMKFFDSEVPEEESLIQDETAIISKAGNRVLGEEFTYEEFTEAINQMHLDKASGPDGLNPSFYQHFWKFLGQELFECCKRWMHDLVFPADLNDTTIFLIPKKDCTSDMKDFRPIALFNVLYKIIAKVLSNRLKSIIPNIITENQSVFVLGINISDNVLVAFELLQFMKMKNSRSEG